MRVPGRSYLKKCFIFIQVILALWVGIYQTSLFGGIKAGTYNVNIKASPITEKHGDAQDTWVFSKDGKFESKGLGIKSEWEETGDDTFKIKIDKQEIIDAIEKSYKLVGLGKSDVSLSIKKIEFSGTSKENTIKGNIKTDFLIKVKRPVKTTFSTSGGVSFQGKRQARTQ